MRNRLTADDIVRQKKTSSILDSNSQPIERAATLVENNFLSHLDPRTRAMEITDRLFKTRDLDSTDKPNRANPRYQNFCDKVELIILGHSSSA